MSFSKHQRWNYDNLQKNTVCSMVILKTVIHDLKLLGKNPNGLSKIANSDKIVYTCER
jgi:hypothetical protein